MTYRKFFSVFILSLFLSTNFVFASECSFANLGACSLGDLKDFIFNFVSFDSKKQVCPLEYVPVCGENGITYHNACELKEGKQALAYMGACLEYPYSLSANECVRDGFEWNGFTCEVLNKENKIYINEDLGIQFEYPGNSLLKDNIIYLPKARNKTNLIYKSLEISNSCGRDLLETTKVISDYSQGSFHVIEGLDDLEYGKNVIKNVYYRDYIINIEDKCVGFLFKLVSDDESGFEKYSLDIEDNIFNEILSSITMVEGQPKLPPCLSYGDLNDDGFVSDKDLFYFDFGEIESNMQKRADLNGDKLITLEDKNILENFNLGLIDSFSVCEISRENNVLFGAKPSVYYDNNVINIKYNKDETDLYVELNFSIMAENGNVYIPIKQGFVLDILNENNLNLRNFIWNTNASLIEDYIYIEDGESKWITMEFNISALNNSYSKVSLSGINYLNNKGDISIESIDIASPKIYLKKIDGKAISPCLNYGDVNSDGYISQEDIDIINSGEYENKEIADVSFNGIVNVIDTIQISKFLKNNEFFSVCLKNTEPEIYSNGSVAVIKNGDYSKHISLAVYLDAQNGNVSIPLSMTLNKDEEAGIYLSTERDGSIKISNVKFYTGAFPNEGYLFLSKGNPYQIRIEFDVEAINDTALVNFKLYKVGYLNEDNEMEYILIDGIETGDMFLNFKEDRFLSACNLGDVTGDGYVSLEDYNYIRFNKNNLLFSSENKFLNADVNRDGIIDDLDLEEIHNVIFSKQSDFSGCDKDVCGDVEPVYTKDGYIYSNLCYANKDSKELKCYLNKDCGL